MSAMANPDAITRTEFEQMALRLAALEASAPRSHAEINEEGRVLSGQSEAVTQNEFRLFKWLGTFVVAAVLGAFGVLYQQIADTRVEMRNLHNTTLRELYTQIGTQIGGVRQEVGDLRQEMGGLRQEMEADLDSIREAIGSVQERVVRVETLLAREEPRTQS